MKASDIPSKFQIPFANSAGGGYIRTIPQASQIGITNGAASLTDGFPPLNFLPVGSGGVPPFGQDMNGILNQATAWSRWQGAGGQVRYDSSFSTAIGGYPQSTILASATSNLLWYNTVDNNTTDPDNGGTNWLAIATVQNSLTLYVATTGNDNNSGLSPSVPFATVQGAINAIGLRYPSIKNITIQVANGTYGPVAANNLTGTNLSLVGNIATPTNVILAGGSSVGFLAANGTQATLNGFRFTSTSTYGLAASGLASVSFSNCDFGNAGSSPYAHIGVANSSNVTATGNYTISGSAGNHIQSLANSAITISGVTVNITSAIAVTQFVQANNGAILADSATFTGSAVTGSRYIAQVAGVIYTAGGGANFFPGSSAGSTATSGVYI